LSAARGEIRNDGEDKEAPGDPPILADTLVTLADQTAAKVTFIEDSQLLREVGGVGALLRYRI